MWNGSSVSLMKFPATELHRIEAEVVRHDVQQPLAEEIRLEPPRRAQGADRRLAGDEGLHRQCDVADAIGTGQELRGLRRHDPAVSADIRTHVRENMPAHGENRAVAFARDLNLAIDLARVVGRNQMLPAILDPFHRPADETRRERDQEFLGIELTLDAEAAADVDLDHVDIGLGHPEHRRQRPAVEEQHFGRAEHRQPFLGGIPFGDLAARLQRQAGQPMTPECLLAGVFGLGEGRVGVAKFRLIAHRAITARTFKQQRFVGCRRMPIRQCRKPLDIEFDRLERVLGQRLGLRHHYRDRLADIADLMLGDDRLQVALELRQIGQPQRNDRHGLADLRCGHDRMHALHGAGA